MVDCPIRAGTYFPPVGGPPQLPSSMEQEIRDLAAIAGPLLVLAFYAHQLTDRGLVLTLRPDSSACSDHPLVGLNYPPLDHSLLASHPPSNEQELPMIQQRHVQIQGRLPLHTLQTTTTSPRLSQYSLPPPPPPHPHLQPQRLPQKPLPRLQLLLIQLKLVPPKHRGDNKRHLHLGHVPADASPGSVGEGDECALLPKRRQNTSA